MTSLFTYPAPTIENIELEPTALQQKILRSFYATVLLGILLSVGYLARRATPLAEPRSANAPSQWVIAALPDPPAALPESASPYIQAHPLKLELVATQDSWVSVVTDGQPSFADLVLAEETRSFEASTRIRLVTGNARGLELRFNGELLAANDRRVRTLEFTSEGARDINSGARVLTNPDNRKLVSASPAATAAVPTAAATTSTAAPTSTAKTTAPSTAAAL